MPIVAVGVALLVLAINEAPGMDGAARALTTVFWFLPTILFLGYKSFSNLSHTSYSKWQRALMLVTWLLPSIPLSIMSYMGIMLLSELGFGILF